MLQTRNFQQVLFLLLLCSYQLQPVYFQWTFVTPYIFYLAPEWFSVICLRFQHYYHEFAQTVATRIIELTPNGIIDRYMTFDEYMDDKNIQELRKKMYNN